MTAAGADRTEFGGQIALVTGAAGQGIGQAIARRLAAGGARVVVTDSHERRTAAVSAAIAADFPDTDVVGMPLDVADWAAIDSVVDRVAAELGPIRILVNNAAFNRINRIYDYDPEDWHRNLAVNLSGPWYLARQVFPQMRDAGGGVVVNVSSCAPDVGGLGTEGAYAIAKGGLNTLTRALAHDGGPFDIRAVTIAMGIVTGTKFIDDHPEQAVEALASTPLGRHPVAAEIAEAVAFVASDRARSITGETLNVCAGNYMRT